jgi:hypothetical protein
MYSILQRDVTGLAYPRKAHLLGLGRCATKPKALIGRPGDIVKRPAVTVGWERYRRRRCPPSIVCRSADGRLRWRVTIATTRLSRPRRSRAGWDARRPRSRRTCMTRLRLTKDLRIAPRANASLGATRADYGVSPGHKVAPSLSRAERTPPSRDGATLRPIPAGARAYARGRYMRAYGSRHPGAAPVCMARPGR